MSTRAEAARLATRRSLSKCKGKKVPLSKDDFYPAGPMFLMAVAHLPLSSKPTLSSNTAPSNPEHWSPNHRHFGPRRDGDLTFHENTKEEEMENSRIHSGTHYGYLRRRGLLKIGEGRRIVPPSPDILFYTIPQPNISSRTPLGNLDVADFYAEALMAISAFENHRVRPSNFLVRLPRFWNHTLEGISLR